MVTGHQRVCSELKSSARSDYTNIWIYEPKQDNNGNQLHNLLCVSDRNTQTHTHTSESES